MKLLLFVSIILISDVTGYILQSDGFIPYSPKRVSAPVMRSFLDEKVLAKRDGHRYYGTGSKSSNSFSPTSVHKSTSSSDPNYFVTSKRTNGLKDLDVAGSTGSEMTSEDGGGGDTSYITVYEPAPQSMHSMMMAQGMDEHYGDMAAETGHGGGGHGGGHGGGGKGCNSALGLLGVLGLAQYLQSVLRNMRNATGRRRRRDIDWDSPLDEEGNYDNIQTGMNMLDEYILPVNQLSDNDDREMDKATHSKVITDIFPLLSAVAHARDGLIPLQCTHSSICLANQVLVKDLGDLGHTLGSKISGAIAKLLSRTANKTKRDEQIKMISKAGRMGRNGCNCLKLFSTCYHLKNLPTYSIPPIMKNEMAHS